MHVLENSMGWLLCKLFYKLNAASMFPLSSFLYSVLLAPYILTHGSKWRGRGRERGVQKMTLHVVSYNEFVDSGTWFVLERKCNVSDI